MFFSCGGVGVLEAPGTGCPSPIKASQSCCLKAPPAHAFFILMSSSYSQRITAAFSTPLHVWWCSGGRRDARGCRPLSHPRDLLRVRRIRGRVVVLTVYALARVAAGDAALEALAVLLPALRLLAVAPFDVLHLPAGGCDGSDFLREGLGVTLHDRLLLGPHHVHVLSGVLAVPAVAALAVQPHLEAVAVHLDALALQAVARLPLRRVRSPGGCGGSSRGLRGRSRSSGKGRGGHCGSCQLRLLLVGGNSCLHGLELSPRRGRGILLLNGGQGGGRSSSRSCGLGPEPGLEDLRVPCDKLEGLLEALLRHGSRGRRQHRQRLGLQRCCFGGGGGCRGRRSCSRGLRVS